MKEILITHYMTEILSKYLSEVSSLFPLQPMGTIVQNFFNFSSNGGVTSNLEDFCRAFYSDIKNLEKMEDPPHIIRNQDGTEEKYKEEELIKRKEELKKQYAEKLKVITNEELSKNIALSEDILIEVKGDNHSGTTG